MTPVGWWHDLQGGAIASTRPPPPGANDPYPKLGTTPPKPVLPSSGFRDTVHDQLAVERDEVERQAARRPIDSLPAAPPPPQAHVSASTDTANATLPAADAAARPPAPDNSGGSAATSPPANASGQADSQALTQAGAAADASGLPPIPEQPPAPATFEGVSALPAPTPQPPLPAHLPKAASGSAVLFATASSTLDPSQNETLKDVVAHRGKGRILVEGHGEAAADTPAAQTAALDLALQRASAIAAALQEMGVPGAAIELSGTAFGRGAALRDTP